MPPGALLAGSPGTSEKESELLYSAGGNNSCCRVAKWCPPGALAGAIADICGTDPNDSEICCDFARLQEFLDVLGVAAGVLGLQEGLRAILELLEEVVCPAFPTIRIKMRSKLVVVVKDGLVHGNWVNQVDPQARQDVTQLAGLVLSHMIQKKIYALSNISDIRYQVLSDIRIYQISEYQISDIRYQNISNISDIRISSIVRYQISEYIRYRIYQNIVEYIRYQNISDIRYLIPDT